MLNLQAEMSPFLTHPKSTDCEFFISELPQVALHCKPSNYFFFSSVVAVALGKGKIGGLSIKKRQHIPHYWLETHGPLGALQE